MTRIDELQLQRLLDRCQQMVGLCGIVERTLATNLDDLKTMSDSLRVIVVALRALPRAEQAGER